jgi:nitrite reductase (NADH) small subunit
MSGQAWTPICEYRRLQAERGVVALLDGLQVAIFRTHDGRLYGLDNFDPLSGAYVLARGIVGTRGELPTVASPMHKQVYDLVSGRCLDVTDVVVRTYSVRCRDGIVEVKC